MSLAALIAALSRALDLTKARPPGHAVRSTWIALRVAREMGLGPHAQRDLFYAVLLKDLGLQDLRASAPPRASRVPELAGEDGPMGRASLLVELSGARAGRAVAIARALRFGDEVVDTISLMRARWDGHGRPRHVGGDDIPMPARIGLLAESVDLWCNAQGCQVALDEAWDRRGRWFDPRVVDVLHGLRHDRAFWTSLHDPELAARLYELEPARYLVPVDDDYLDDIVAAVGDVIDARSSFTSEHSARVASLTALLAQDLGLTPPHVRWLRRGAQLHDLGKLGVSNAILEKPGRLDDDELRAVRAHAALTEEVMQLIPAFGHLARVAGAHHERLDGGGYPWGLRGEEIPLETRLITVADVFDALSAERPYRAAMELPRVMDLMRREVGTAFDARVFAALASRARDLERASLVHVSRRPGVFLRAEARA